VNRIDVVATVLGAFLLGGVGTGATYARWVDQAPLPPSSARSGAMSFTASALPAALSVARGTTTTSQVTVADTSQGKNLVQRITPAVAATNGVTASLVTRSGGSCTTTVQAPVALTPSQSFTTCVNVTVPSGTTASSATVNVTLTGAQVRGSTVAGWTSGPQVVSIPVTITGNAPTAPVITCGSSSNNQQVINWTAVSGANGYEVLRSPVQDSGYVSLSTVTASTYTYAPTGNETNYFRVRATNVGGSSAFSNTLRITRSGSTVTCTAVTP
jgi:hypothetical protein